MVTKLKDNKEYIEYIRKRMYESIPDCKQSGEPTYEGQMHNNFQYNFQGNFENYIDSPYKISFVNDRGLLELRIYDKGEQVNLGYLLYNLILENIPYQDSKWRTSLCVELIDFYVDFLKKYCTRIKAV
jgi:hypothetical protein